MTSSPARMMGLVDRGELRPGNEADIVVFDPDTVGDRSTAETPREPAVGSMTWRLIREAYLRLLVNYHFR